MPVGAPINPELDAAEEDFDAENDGTALDAREWIPGNDFEPSKLEEKDEVLDTLLLFKPAKPVKP